MQELQDKFGLREFEASRFLFNETVIPTYEIGGHLKKWEVTSNTQNVTTTGDIFFFEVPNTERWILRAYQVIYLMTGAIKGSGLIATLRPNTSAHFIYLDLKKGQEVSYLVNLPCPVVLEPGNMLKYVIDTYVSSQNLTIYIDIQKEEIR